MHNDIEITIDDDLIVDKPMISRIKSLSPSWSDVLLNDHDFEHSELNFAQWNEIKMRYGKVFREIELKSPQIDVYYEPTKFEFDEIRKFKDKIPEIMLTNHNQGVTLMSTLDHYQSIINLISNIKPYSKMYALLISTAGMSLHLDWLAHKIEYHYDAMKKQAHDNKKWATTWLRSHRLKEYIRGAYIDKLTSEKANVKIKSMSISTLLIILFVTLISVIMSYTDTVDSFALIAGLFFAFFGELINIHLNYKSWILNLGKFGHSLELYLRACVYIGDLCTERVFSVNYIELSKLNKFEIIRF
jgi:hypothetical protein